MNRNLLSVFIFCLTLLQALGQDIVFDGKISELESGKSLGGVTITAKAGGSQVASTTTSSNGKYTLNVPVGKLYVIEYSKPGYVTKIMKIHTEEITDEDLPIGGRVMPAVDIDLFTTKESIDFSFMKEEPVVEWNWDSKKLRMDWDKKVYKNMKDKIDDLLKKAEEKEKEREAKYNELISEADKLFDAKNYEASLAKYEAAVKISGKEMEEHPNSRILELDELLKAKAKEELLKEQAGQKYKEKIAEAESLRANEKYDKAIDKFYEALDLKPGEVYPLDQIDELNVLLKEKENKNEYDRLVKSGDDFLEQNSLKAAKDKFEKASQLMPSEVYPKEQLKIIEQKFKAAEEEQLKKQKYDEAISAADTYFEDKDYENAKEKYKEAIGYEKAATYPKARLDLVNEKLDEIAKEAADKKAFDLLITKADNALKNSQYEEAISQYEAALDLKKGDSYATSQRKKAKEALEALEDAAAMEAKITELLTKAENHLQSEDYKSAINEFKAVLDLDANNVQARNGKERAQKALNEKEAQAELKESFDSKVAEADKLFSNNDLEGAKSKYKEANGIIPNNDHVISQLEKIEDKLDKVEKEKALKEQVNSLIAKANKELENENWKSAIDKFDDALKLDESNQEALKGKETATEKLKDFEKKQNVDEQFNKIIEEADQLFKKKEWEAAKEKYKAANEIKKDKVAEIKIEEIDEILAQLEADKLAKENYEAAIEAGDKAMSNNSFDNAITAYNEALAIKENDKIASEKLGKATALKEKYETFEQLKKEGADLVTKKSWEEAKEKYQKAKAINEDETVKSQLELINKELNKLATAEELEKKFNALLKEAETLEANENYEKAIKKLEEALEVKENDSVTTQKINDLKAKLLSLNKAEENEAAYKAKMNVGNKAVISGDYAEAIEAFDDALELKPEDTEALKQKKIAKEALSVLAKQEEDYQKLLSIAKTKKEEGELYDAKAMYKEAQKQRPKDAVPQNAIVEIDELLRQKEESEGVEKRYDNKINQADNEAESLNYEQAILLYKEAGKIKPEEEYPKKRVKEIQSLIDQMMAKSKENSAYEEKINKADAAYDKNNFEESIDLYKQALLLDKDASYPKDQISKAEAKLKSLEDDELDKEFQGFMKKGNTALASEEYEDAINSYNEALKLKPNNQETKDRKAEAEALLEAALADAAADKEKQKKYDKIIKEADDLFNKQEYIDAKEKYEKALSVMRGDQYAIDRIEESIALAQEKVKKGDDIRYQKIIDKADEYFEAENYDKATSLYQRALGLRSQDQYPADQLEEIERILAGDVKVDKKLEYLGEAEEISIMEGAALLEKAESQRQNLKSQKVIDQTKKHEEIFLAKNQDDLEERMNVQNEVTRIHDLRVEGYDKDNKMKQEMSKDIDAQSFSIAEQRIQENKYERASILKQNQEFAYYEDDFRNIHEEKKSEHLAIADKIYEIRVDYDIAQNNKNLSAKEKWQTNDGKFADYSEDMYQDYQRAIELRKENETFIKDQTYYIDEQRQVNNTDNYNKILSIQSEATDIEREIAAKHADKIQVQAEIEKDILALEKRVSDKNQNESRELKKSQLKTDEFITTAYDQYLKSIEGADENRIRTIADIKRTNEDIDVQKQVRDQRKEDAIRGTETVVLDAKKMNEEHLREMNEDLVETFKKVDDIDNELKRKSEFKRNEEVRSRQEVMGEVDKVNMQQVDFHSDKVRAQSEIEKNIQAQQEFVADKNREESQQLSKKWLETDEFITTAYDQYLKSIEVADENRIRTIADIKRTNENIDVQKQVRDQRKEAAIRGTETVVLDAKKMNEEHLREMNEDLVETFKKIDDVDNKLKRQAEFERDKDARSRRNTMDEVDNTNILQDKIHSDKKSKVEENSERIKNMDASTDSKRQRELKEQADRRMANQQKIDEEAKKEKSEKPIIANTLGDDYPEGVTQETFVTKDKDGLPVKVITRRIVVVEGRGVEYRRIETRNGVAYSKNGEAITENVWNKDTMNAKLDKHF